MFNVPPVVATTIAALAFVHAVRTYGLTAAQDKHVLLLFAFFPARFDATLLTDISWPGGAAGEVWSFVTYALLHGDWTHFALNAVWLLAFGSAVARRFGALRWLAFFAITAAGGAAAHLLAHPGDFWPMVGASASISGFMAGAMRFVFDGGGPLGLMRRGHHADYHVPARPLLVALRDPRVLAFLGVWFALNLLFGASSFSMVDDQQSIAWEAHIGGFLAGLLLFPLFDPVPARTQLPGDDFDPGAAKP
jgi:membrane associated rhomboid family serine protease